MEELNLNVAYEAIPSDTATITRGVSESTGSQKFRINLNEGTYGYNLNIGCQGIFLSSHSEAIKLITYYLENKLECLRLYSENKLEDKIKEVLK